jgi:hypothetical protein
MSWGVFAELKHAEFRLCPLLDKKITWFKNDLLFEPESFIKKEPHCGLNPKVDYVIN